jgi:hypothetical protein
MPLGLVNSTDPAIENSFHGRDRRGVGRGWPPSAALKVRPDGNVNNQGLHLAMPVYRVDHINWDFQRAGVYLNNDPPRPPVAHAFCFDGRIQR